MLATEVMFVATFDLPSEDSLLLLCLLALLRLDLESFSALLLLLNALGFLEYECKISISNLSRLIYSLTDNKVKSFLYILKILYLIWKEQSTTSEKNGA